MSFTSIVKNEVSKLPTNKIENITELSAMLRNIADINSTIHITTENANVARRIFQLIKELYDVVPKITVRKGYNFQKGYLYLLQITNQVDQILEQTGLKQNQETLICPPSYITDDTDLKRAYLRGLFLACGSINDPKKSRYHLEFLVDHENYAEFISLLLNTFHLHSKVIKRDLKYMIYVKEAEKIGDFLRIINAPVAVLYYEDIRIYRDHKNMTNRLNNCEQANVDKTIESATKQVKDIELIETEGVFELLDDKIKEAAIYRKKYPEASLLELSEIISFETGNEITKPGLYHRFQRIKSLAKRIRENDQK